MLYNIFLTSIYSQGVCLTAHELLVTLKLTSPYLLCCWVQVAEQTPLSALRIGELALEAGLPAGVLNIIQGAGGVTGAALSKHPGVDKVGMLGIPYCVGRDLSYLRSFSTRQHHQILPLSAAQLLMNKAAHVLAVHIQILKISLSP